MPHVLEILNERFTEAISRAAGAAHAGADPLLRPSAQAKFGDYQANAAMSLGKQIGRPPRELAEAIVQSGRWEDICQKVEVAGPGFINLTLRDSFINAQLAQMAADDGIGLPRAKRPWTVVVDYSSPNVAKQMHIGHLRSTIIGDAIARVLERLGHRVIRQNHVGDWGTQFGMLIEYLIETGAAAEDELKVADLEALYRAAQQRYEADEAFAAHARQRVVDLQAGDITAVTLWRALVDESKRHFEAVYRRLGVKLTDADIRGESFYNDQLPGIVNALEKRGLLHDSEGAKVLYPEGFKNTEGEPLGMIVRKRDGGYLYATTDLAAAKYRIEQLGADRLIYVTDSRQNQHFAMLFQALREAGWAPEHVRLEHVPFGMVLGKDRRPLKTRSGRNVRLDEVLDEAVERAGQIIAEKNPEMAGDWWRDAAEAIGTGALKYADLSGQRIKDYIFDWDQMLAFDGNTAPYLQNAYVRIRSIFRKGEIDPALVDPGAIAAEEPAERDLALKLLQFPEVVGGVAETLEPHRLCSFLYEVATGYHRFYENCPVLTAGDESRRQSRLALCDLAARILAAGLDLLGIRTIEQM